MKHTYRRIITTLLIGFILGFTSPAQSAPLMHEVIKGRPELSLFFEAIGYAHAEDVFKANPDSVPAIVANLPLMVFVPNNDAMTKAGWTSEKMKEVAASEESEGFDPNKVGGEGRSEIIRNFLKQHVCMKVKDKAASLKPEYERFEGDKLTVKGDTISGEVDGKSKSAKIVTPDIDAESSIIHIIDNILGHTPEEGMKAAE